MKYENIKSVLLTLLVAMSIFLTWNLWTYQPDYDVIESTEAFEVTIGDERKKLELIKPYKVFYNHGNKISGSNDGDEIDKILYEMSSWRLFDTTDLGNQYSRNEIEELVHGKDRIDLVFPDSIPLSTYGGIVKFDEKNLPKASFNRIIIDMDLDKANNGTVYFVLYGEDDKKEVVESKIDLSKLQSLERKFVQKAIYSDIYEEYFKYKVNDRKTILLPVKEGDYYNYKYSTEQLNEEDFVKALFKDPINVSGNTNGAEKVYRDSSSLMKINDEYSILSFVNPGVDVAQSISESELIDNSIQFVNEHGGWTDQFKFFSMSKEESRVSFRMFLYDFPVFSDNYGMTEISETWGLDTIHQYQRPFYQLGDDYSSIFELVQVQLPSGYTVQQALEESDLNLGDVEDIAIGYKLTRDMTHDDILLYDFKPSWYYKYSGSWLRLPLEEFRGLENGLE
ncbi:two-component system activity regulator YycH [Rossellomorea aquimaris]|uniref:YycH family regulatory protein n=1 Tax=Rossellomorea aquimaris TaxID=189382 RepID=UPI001CD4F232|nr:two-component system activity regulator YycH [Rossellomorea aquimaris]MCA1054916.1 two-component system activity regulator YycH [Rossellomorea aquimaris]